MSDTTSTPPSSAPRADSPLDGLLSASREHRIEALDHFLVAADELVQSTKSIVAAAESAIEFGRAWAVREREEREASEEDEDESMHSNGKGLPT